MRHRFRFGAALTAFALAACGGSSSETPPPLQPDPAGFRYASTPPMRIADESDAGDAPQTVPESSGMEPQKPRAPARSTWGSAAPAH